MRLLFTLMISLALAGCQSINTESIYEGIRSQQKSNKIGKDMPKPTLPNYEQYEKERKSNSMKPAIAL